MRRESRADTTVIVTSGMNCYQHAERRLEQQLSVGDPCTSRTVARDFCRSGFNWTHLSLSRRVHERIAQKCQIPVSPRGM